MTIKYYNDNAASFFAGTVDIDMSELHNKFISYLPEGALILDAGCGSGRDSLAFQKLGFAVEAFDASEALVKKASELTGIEVQLKQFHEVNEINKFDGIWTCASLLHLPRTELESSMRLLSNALKPNGVWYLSFKYGTTEREIDGRHFTDMNEYLLQKLVNSIGDLSVIEMWISMDKRPDRDEKWLNAIIGNAISRKFCNPLTCS
jgi:SAM-dependent methyltransferase